MLASIPFAVIVPLSGAGCSCADVDCTGASIAVDLGAGPSADAARICINAECEIVSGSAGDWPAGWVALRFDAVPATVYDDEDFELEITVLDVDGSAIASTTHMRNFDVDNCSCLAFPYRLVDSEIKRAD